MYKFEIRCPKCNKVFGDKNETKFKVWNLLIIFYSKEVIVFECSNCNHHIPVMFTSVFNVVSMVTNDYFIGKNKLNLV